MPSLQLLNKLERLRAFNGTLAIRKPYGLTSFDCLRYLNLALTHAHNNLTRRHGFVMHDYPPLPMNFVYPGRNSDHINSTLQRFPPPNPKRVTLLNSMVDAERLDPHNLADLYLYTLMSGYPSSLIMQSKKKYRLKLGHGGTLDPLASGVL
ncbi:hypothetical protein IWQ60_012569, partial [Tieghemiomyces parasiticus]